MAYSILCPQNHLILAEPRCPECNWPRPSGDVAGRLAWEPVDLGGGLGGPGKSLAPVGIGPDLAVVPMRSGTLRLVCLDDGRMIHTWPVDRELAVRGIVADRGRMLVSLCDERSYEQAQSGWLAVLDPRAQTINKVWEASGHALSPVTVSGDVVLARTSRPEIVALDRNNLSTVKWRTGLEGGLLHPPLVVQDWIVMCGGRTLNYESHLAVYTRADGCFLWKEPVEDLINFDPPAVSGHRVFFRSSKTSLTELDLENRRTRRLLFNLIYSPPVIGRCLYLVTRGNPDEHAKDHYVLQALDVHTLQEQWRLPLPDRVRQLIVTDNDLLLLAGDHGIFMAVDGNWGKELWRHSVFAQDDPLRTALAFNGSLLLGGTYGGKLAAMTVLTRPGDPDQLLARGDREGAAAAYAVRKEFRKAGDLYASLQRWPEAAALYERVADFERAGQLARQEAGGQTDQAKKEYWLKRALEDYHRSGNRVAEAEIHRERGDQLSAARCLEAAQKYDEAAHLYEEIQYYQDAVRLYQALGRVADERRLRRSLPLGPDDLQQIERQDGYIQAGQIAFERRMFREAADIYRRNADEARELEAMDRLVMECPEPWATARLIELTRKSGRYFQEGQLWETYYPENPEQAADAFWRAARQAEYSNLRDAEQIINLYERAESCFRKAGLNPEAHKCVPKIREYRRSPVIEIEVHAPKGFSQNGSSRLDLIIANTGWGRAEQISFSVESACFEQISQTHLPISALAVGKMVDDATIYIKALLSGEAVPFTLKWNWQGNGEHFSDELYRDLPVSSPQSSSTPPPIIYNSGTLNLADKITQGDYIETGGQKGDRLTQEFKPSEPGKPASRPKPRVCPHCSLPQEDADGKYCVGCGKPLQPVEEGLK